MSTTLATIAPVKLRSPVPASYGSGTAVETKAGSVSAFFALESFDRHRGVALYALRVVNGTASVLVCRTWLVSRTGDAAFAHPLCIEVPPLATTSTLVPISPGDFVSFGRAIAEIAGDGVRCVVEAPSPVRRESRSPYLAAAAISLAGLLLLGTGEALHGALPRIAAFAVPPVVMAGTTARAEYEASGAGGLSYTVIAPDGHTLQGGTLGDAAGVIPVAIPASNAPGAYTLQMNMSGPLGTASATRVLNTLASRGAVSHAQKIAEIASISVNPPVARPGEIVDVAYAAQGAGGYVRLVGQDGTVWQQQPFSHSGAARFTIPAVPSLREMRVLLHVVRGRSTAQSMAGLVIANTGAFEPSAAAQIVGDNDPALPAASSSEANETFEVLTPKVAGGGAIRVRILSPRNGMRIALTDAQSHEVTGADVGADEDAITLRAPAVSVATRYTIVASFTDGFGQESVIEPVTVVP